MNLRSHPVVTAAIRRKHLADTEGGRGLVEKALPASEERYRMLLDGIQDYAIFMMDPQGWIVSWNAGAERIKGYRAGEIIGHNFSCFFPPEEVERGAPEEILRKAASSGRYEEQGIRVRKDGSRFLASFTFTALRDAQGNLEGFSEFSHDLSESKEAGAKYRGLLEAAPDAMVVVNQQGEIVLLNVQAEKQFGYRRDELVGQKVKNIIPEGFAERLIADGLRSPVEALAQQIGTGIELIALRKDGSEFPIELMLSPLESTEGILVTAAIRNISVRKEGEKHLAQMEGRYRGLLEAAPDAMVVVNQSGEIVLLNVQAQKQFGYRRDELVGQKVKNIIPEGFAERLIADGLRSPVEALAQQIGSGIELIALRKDGSEFPIELMLSPLESTEGILVTAAIRNISVRKEAERTLTALEHSNTELDDFAYIASHDLKEPLRGIHNHARFLLEDNEGKLDEDSVGRLHRLTYLSQRMETLVNDLLYFSRLGRQKLAVQATDLNAVVHDIEGTLDVFLGERNASIAIPKKLPITVCDKIRVAELFRNLITNGIKYNDKARKVIEIGHLSSHGTAHGKRSSNVFYVKDNGRGISPEF
jgi:PAS domain S-box-containing protein